jgi:hypothetical protein
MSDRARYRDFYDIFLVLDSHVIDLKEVVELVKKKEVRQPITKANIEKNWQIVLTQKEKEMIQIYYSRPVKDIQIEEMIESLPLIEVKKGLVR